MYEAFNSMPVLMSSLNLFVSSVASPSTDPDTQGGRSAADVASKPEIKLLLVCILLLPHSHFHSLLLNLYTHARALNFSVNSPTDSCVSQAAYIPERSQPAVAAAG